MLVTLLRVLAGMAYVQAGALDWTNPTYAVKAVNDPRTSEARNTIIKLASSTARKGPWTVVDTNDIKAPSGDPGDYLSWAPYWWPDCNWCPSRDDQTESKSDSSPFRDGRSESSSEIASTVDSVLAQVLGDGRRDVNDGILPHRVILPNPPSIAHNRLLPVPYDPIGGPPPLRTDLPDVTTSASKSSQTGIVDGAPPPQAKAKPKKQPPKGKCTPSPTGTAAAPSATWSTCPYEVRDGKRNPDVHALKDIGVIYAATHSIIYNTLAYIFTRSSEHSANAVRFIDAFFLAPKTRMNPSAKYGQLIRGPGPEGKKGTYQGVLDMRWLALVGNAVTILRQNNAKEWDQIKDTAFRRWMAEYTDWIEGSYQGQQAMKKANNHGTFCAAQLASIKLAGGDAAGATKVIKKYFDDVFPDQIARNGNQPLEWARTRPFHYVCFNLEAMIMVAKLADQLNIDYWSRKSRYGATIQDAVNYAMSVASQSSKQEDVTEILPHVLVADAVYGDPDGKYAAFIKKWSPPSQPYEQQPSWFYNQPAAFQFNAGKMRNPKFVRKDEHEAPLEGSFQCPGEVLLIDGIQVVELDVGLYVSCADLELLYNV